MRTPIPLVFVLSLSSAAVAQDNTFYLVYDAKAVLNNPYGQFVETKASTTPKRPFRLVVVHPNSFKYDYVTTYTSLEFHTSHLDISSLIGTIFANNPSADGIDLGKLLASGAFGASSSMNFMRGNDPEMQKMIANAKGDNLLSRLKEFQTKRKELLDSVLPSPSTSKLPEVRKALGKALRQATNAQIRTNAAKDVAEIFKVAIPTPSCPIAHPGIKTERQEVDFDETGIKMIQEKEIPEKLIEPTKKELEKITAKRVAFTKASNDLRQYVEQELAPPVDELLELSPDTNAHQILRLKNKEQTEKQAEKKRVEARISLEESDSQKIIASRNQILEKEKNDKANKIDNEAEEVEIKIKTKKIDEKIGKVQIDKLRIQAESLRQEAMDAHKVAAVALRTGLQKAAEALAGEAEALVLDATAIKNYSDDRIKEASEIRKSLANFVSNWIDIADKATQIRVTGLNQRLEAEQACGKLFNQLLDLEQLPTYAEAELLPRVPGDAVEVTMTVKEGPGLPGLPTVPDAPVIELIPGASDDTGASSTTTRALELARAAIEAKQPAAEKKEPKDLSVRKKTVPVYGRQIIDYSIGGYLSTVRPRNYAPTTGTGIVTRKPDGSQITGGAHFFHYYTTDDKGATLLVRKPLEWLKRPQLALGLDVPSDFKKVNSVLFGPTLVFNLGSPDNRMFLSAGLAWTQQTVLNGVSLGENATLKTRRNWDRGQFISLSFALRIKSLGGK